MQNVSEMTDQTSLSAPYERCAIYYEDADTVEYLRRSVHCVYRRVDEWLTLAYDFDARSTLVGFRLKGFKNFYLRHLRPTQEVLDSNDFLSLVRVLEKTVEYVGERVIQDDPDRRDAYARAYQIAREDAAVLDERDLPKAA
jgi:hypothetical protein